MSIHVLSDELSNQIAAGEVIESPAMLIKELIENSLDAKANTISITIEESGLKYIKVEDNGVGIEKDDLSLAPLRHSTSKISTFEDLYSISTMGFRGEALASIFSIAKVELISKPKYQEYAYKITNINNNSSQKKVGYTPQKAASNDGTTIIISDLFYNTPARKKYLSTPQHELKKIIEVVKLIALIHPSLQISLVHNSKTLFSKPFFDSLHTNIQYILSSTLSNTELIEVSNSTPQMILSGYIANPNEITFATKKYCYLFINSRPITSALLHKAIMSGIGTNIHSGRFPLYLINIIIDPQLIDVNIHPSKKEVKFEQELVIFSVVSEAISQLFTQASILPSMKHASKQQRNNTRLIQDEQVAKTLSNKSTSSHNSSHHPQFSNYFSRDLQQELSNVVHEEVAQYEIQNNSLNEDVVNFSSDINKEDEQEIVSSHVQENSQAQTNSQSSSPLLEYLGEYRVVGQLLKTYIIVETPRGMLIIDQHVVEEKFYYELFKSQFHSTKKSTQQLLKPEILRISQEERIAYEQLNKLLEQLGFDIELLQENELIIRQVPLNLKGKELPTQIIKDMLLDFDEYSNQSSESFEEYLIEHLSSLSCKASIRAGEEKTHSQLVELIEKLKTLDEPFNCPHGRPIIMEFSSKYLEKLFGRR
ncbi:MAG: DNA mismatch repair endonuclease MutL [Candidatus Nanoarchaeia archaeon]